MESRGRGRARGRAREGQQQQQQQQRPQGPRQGQQQQSRPQGSQQGPPQPRPTVGPRQGPPQPRPTVGPRHTPGSAPQQVASQPLQAPGAQGPWNRPAGPLQAQQPAAPSHWVRAPMPSTAPTQSAGRGSRLGGGGGGGDSGEVTPSEERAGELLATGEGTAARSGGNGGVRGRTLRNEIIFTRPANLVKQGTSGRRIKLVANYFQLLTAGKWGLNQYRVDFNPDVDHTGQRKRYMNQAMQGAGITGFLFDGTVMYTTQRLHPDPMEKLVESDGGEKLRITIRLVGDVAWGDYHYIQLFNIIIRKCLCFLDFKLVGRNYFDPDSRISIPEYVLELWPGYVTSMRQHETDILLNSDLAFKIMRQDNVYDLLLECRSNQRKQEFQSRIVGSIVLTYYNNKTYKVDDVDWESSPETKFSKKDGTQISFVEYYRSRYNIHIQVKNQPMLISRSKPREIRAGMPETVVLVPELCQLTGLTDAQRENFHLMRALADHTRIGPPGRMAKLREFSQRMQNCPAVMNELRSWDLRLATDLVNFHGRTLPPETILGAPTGGQDQKGRPKHRECSAGPQADWTRSLRETPMFNAVTLSRHGVIFPVRMKKGCQDFLQSLRTAAKGMNWDIGQTKPYPINDDRYSGYIEAIELALRDDVQLIICIVPNNSAERYSAIKKKTCVDTGIPTQVVLAKQFNAKGVMSIATKIVIQLNCKLGGAPWSIYMPLSHLMIVGYDVCRDTMNKGKSFAAMVASLDQPATRYFNHVSEHAFEEELSNNFAAFMILACRQYHKVHQKYPDRILIYRDGVGDGQLPYVVDHEVENIKRKLISDIYKEESRLKLAFVVVSKRINTRIFAESGNPPPGTIVDDVITLPERYDFFIVSQCVRQGTVSPTSYNVIFDTMGLPPDRMQMLTYKLCHMYFNWSGTVRVPAPCQYAHKLAYLTAQNLHRAAHRNLENLLFYL